MLWPLSVVLVANTNGRLAIPALAGLLVSAGVSNCRSLLQYGVVHYAVAKTAKCFYIDRFHITS